MNEMNGIFRNGYIFSGTMFLGSVFLIIFMKLVLKAYETNRTELILLEILLGISFIFLIKGTK